MESQGDLCGAVSKRPMFKEMLTVCKGVSRTPHSGIIIAIGALLVIGDKCYLLSFSVTSSWDWNFVQRENLNTVSEG